MNSSSLDRAPVTLDAGVALRLRNGVGRGVALLGGKVWITQEGDPRDIVIDGDESFVFDRPGLAMVEAIVGSTMLLFEVERRARPKRPQDVTVRSGAA